MSAATIDLISDYNAYDLLNDEQFIRQWISLFNQCDYATVFQHPSFVQTWYETYRLQWKPVLIKYQSNDGHLKGLWLLAYSNEKKALVHAGAHQAEYQVWLAQKDEELDFITNAWSLLKVNINFEELHFKYIPCCSLCGILKHIQKSSNCVIQRKYDRPVQELSSVSLRSMFSKRNKQRIKHLAALGNLEFRRISSPEEFDNIFPELTELYDYRMGAVNGIRPFQDDKFKRQFYSNLLKKDNELFIVSVTYLNGRPIAGGLSGLTKGTVHLYMGMHSPVFNMYSPGITHMLQLSEYLYNEGFKRIDLTPGGDSWKERFATQHDEVAYVTLYKSNLKKTGIKLKHFVKSGTKTIIDKIGINTLEIRNAIQQNRLKMRTLTSIAKGKKWNYLDLKVELYECRSDSLKCGFTDDLIEVKSNSLDNLLSFSPDGEIVTKKGFLHMANNLFERGAESFSVKQGSDLQACAWMLPNQSTFKVCRNSEPVELPTNGTVIFNFYVSSQLAHRKDCEKVICKILSSIKKTTDDEFLYVFIESKNTKAITAIQSADFRYLDSYSRELSHLWQN